MFENAHETLSSLFAARCTTLVGRICLLGWRRFAEHVSHSVKHSTTTVAARIRLALGLVIRIDRFSNHLRRLVVAHTAAKRKLRARRRVIALELARQAARALPNVATVVNDTEHVHTRACIVTHARINARNTIHVECSPAAASQRRDRVTRTLFDGTTTRKGQIQAPQCALKQLTGSQKCVLLWATSNVSHQTHNEKSSVRVCMCARTVL